MSPEIEALAEANDALRRARNLLDILSTAMLGAFTPQPECSPLAETLTVIREAEARCRRVMRDSLRAPEVSR